jgi:formylglycine-generating enzyme required for sulfatase activity
MGIGIAQVRFLTWALVGLACGLIILLLTFLAYLRWSDNLFPKVPAKQSATPGSFPVLGTAPEQTTTPKAGIGSKQISPKDGMWMVYVPQGNFQMGSDDGTDYEKPMHTVWLDAFWIDKTEVTNTQFEEFVRQSNYQTDAEVAGWSYVYDMASTKWLKVSGANWRHPRGPSSNLDGLENHPVTYISWNDALAYCRWAGRRLPSEAEWEKAARGTDSRIYPWGNQRPDQYLLNFADKNISLAWADKNMDDGYAFTSPVGNYPQGVSPYGALDMAGNVWEWVNDWYDPNYYQQQTFWSNPAGPSVKSGRVLRGGSWADSANVTRSSFRLAYYPMDWYAFYGFRCAESPLR